MDRNFFTAIVAMMALLIGYNLYYEWRFGDYIREQEQIEALEEAAKSEEQGAESPGASQSGTPVVKVDNSSPTKADSTESIAVKGAKEPGSSSPISGESGAAPMADERERITSIDTGVTQVVLTNRGGVLRNYFLSNYQDYTKSSIDLHFDYQSYLKKKAEDDEGAVLVKIKTYPTLGLIFPREAFSDKINSSFFTVSSEQERVVLTDETPTQTLTYRLIDPSGVEIVKKFTFKKDSYLFDFEVMVLSKPAWGEFDYQLIWFGLTDEHIPGQMAYVYNGPIILKGSERIQEAPDEDDTSISHTGTIGWAGLTNRYYTAVGLPQFEGPHTVITRYVDDENSAVNWKLSATTMGHPSMFSFYVGPKHHAAMGQETKELKGVIDYGIFDIIAKPLFWAMDYFHGWTDNWGWSIILLTVTVKILFFPLTQKSFKSMQKMVEVQPEMKKIQDLYKDDKEKLNAALMDLYREKKINPFGSCLPIFLQIPIFFALYTVLAESIELKGEGWIWWITDLGQKDPYYITPVLMGATMFIQQLLTPATGDPMQRKIFLAMPIVFTFLFLSFPSGLVLYWLVNNVLTIIQQWVIRRQAETHKAK